MFQAWESQPWLLNVGHHTAIIGIFFSLYIFKNIFILFLFSSHQRQQIVTGLYQPTPEESRWEDSEDEDDDDEEDDKKPLQDKPQKQDGKKLSAVTDKTMSNWNFTFQYTCTCSLV